MEIKISRTTIDDKLWDIQAWIMRHYGIDEGSRRITPLAWYINTGRASTEFLDKFLNTKTVVIGWALMKDGSDDEVINRVKSKLES